MNSEAIETRWEMLSVLTRRVLQIQEKSTFKEATG